MLLLPRDVLKRFVQFHFEELSNGTAIFLGHLQCLLEAAYTQHQLPTNR